MTTRIVVVVGTRPEAIKLAPVVRRLRQDARAETLFVSAYEAMISRANPYGDGRAAERIADALLRAPRERR